MTLDSKPNLTPSSSSDIELKVSRRRLAQQAAMIAGGIAATGVFSTVSASDATPEASPEASPSASPVAVVTPDPNATFKVVSPTREEVIAQYKGANGFEEPANTGGDVIQVFSSDITMVNPMLAQDLASGFVTDLIYQSLVSVNAVDGTYVPALADSWELSSDGVRWRFHLNPNAIWHDGKPVTADDVLFSFAAMLAPDGLAPSRGTLERALANIEKINDHTVELTSPVPMAIFLTNTASNVPIMPMHIWGDVANADWPSDEGTTGRNPARVIGSGPFKFVEWVQNDHVTVARNDDYWLKDEIPVIDRYIYRIVAASTAALQSLQTGEADISSVSPAQAPSFIEKNPDLTITKFNRANITYYETNMDETKTTL
ncbi:MAG: ABC transporter substrate-binding protein, partial [Thermomicrobiales bacterium]